MADKIPCFAKVNIPDLAKLFDSKYKEGMSEAEQRQIGTDIALDYHKKLFEELNTFKEKDLKIKLTKEQKTYVSPDKSEAIKKITDDYQKQIDEANTPIPEPIKAVEDVLGTPSKTNQPVQQNESATQEQGTETAVSESTTATGQGNAETTTSILDNTVKRVPLSSGITENDRQRKIKEREEESKASQRDIDEQEIIDDIKAYGKMPNGRQGKLSTQGLNRLNRIRLKISDYNKKYKQSYRFDDRGIKLRNSNGKVVNSKNINPDSRIVKDAVLLKDRDNRTIAVFNALFGANAMPTGYSSNGVRLSNAQMDKVLEDILDGIPSLRANNYLNQLEEMIEKDDYDFTNTNNPYNPTFREVKLEDILSSEALESIDETAIDNYLIDESQLTPEIEVIVSDNIDNLITEYEQERTESEVGQNEPIAETTSNQSTQQGNQAQSNNQQSQRTQQSGSKLAENKSLADKIRLAKLGKNKTFDATLGIPVAIWDGAVEALALAVESGESIANAVKKGIDYIKGTSWYSGLTDEQKERSENAFSEEFTEYSDTSTSTSDNSKVSGENVEMNNVVNEITQTGEVKKYLSGETIIKYTGDSPNNSQEYISTELSEAFKQGENVIERAKEIYGKEYVSKLVDYVENTNMPVSTKALIYVSLRNDLYLRRMEADAKEYPSVIKEQEYVYAKSQAFAHENSVAMNMWKLQNIQKYSYDLDNTTLSFLSEKQREQRSKLESSVAVDDDAVNKEYESNEGGLNQADAQTAQKIEEEKAKEDKGQRVKTKKTEWKAKTKDKGKLSSMIAALKNKIDNLNCN